VHVNWPSGADPIYLANPTEQNARKTCYNVNSVPWNQIDGVIHSTDFTGSYNTRMAVPCHLSILACRNGDASSGNVSVRLIAEQDLGLSSLRLFCTLVENNAPGAGLWSSSSFAYAFRDNIFGVVGPSVEFAPPYPDTLYFEAPYAIDPGWAASNMYLITFVQQYASSLPREIANSSFDNFLGLPTGLEGSPSSGGGLSLFVFPNPSSGTFSVDASLPGDLPGSVSVYDLAGRTVFSGSTSETPLQVSVAQPGVYLVRLTGPGGTSVERSVAVVD